MTEHTFKSVGPSLGQGRRSPLPEVTYTRRKDGDYLLLSKKLRDTLVHEIDGRQYVRIQMSPQGGIRVFSCRKDHPESRKVQLSTGRVSIPRVPEDYELPRRVRWTLRPVKIGSLKCMTSLDYDDLT